MKSLSSITNNLKQSDIRAVTAMVNKVNGINLGQGICDLPTPQPIKDGAKKAIDDNKSIYAPFAGLEELKESVLGKVQRFNQIPANSVDEILISVGSTGGFVTAMFALLESGDDVILFEPYYGYHSNLLRVLHVNQKVLPMRGTNWDIDFDELERSITPKTKAIVINTPSNPCGKVWSRDELQTMLDLLQKYDLYAVTDEVYEYMVYDHHKHVSLASLPEAFERTITLSSFSKTYNMTGWRLGFATGPENIIHKMGLLNDLFYICAPTPLQHGLNEGFSMGPEYFDEILSDYDVKRTMMCEALEQAGFEVPWPQGAYYAFVNFEALSQKLSGFDNAREACETLINKTGVASIPGSSFFANPDNGKYFLRFCFAKEMDVLKDACDRLKELHQK
ncbi:MAG: pyridoxal phosphate-dependent aminotransferase [Balneolales bacterium]